MFDVNSYRVQVEEWFQRKSTNHGEDALGSMAWALLDDLELALVTQKRQMAKDGPEVRRLLDLLRRFFSKDLEVDYTSQRLADLKNEVAHEEPPHPMVVSQIPYYEARLQTAVRR